MPYALRKVGDKYFVVNRETGHKFSHKPLSHERALRQIRAIYANTRGLSGGILVGGKCTESIDPFSQEELNNIPQKYRIDILIGTNPATGETIEHCFDIRQLAHYFVASQTSKNPYTNDYFKPAERKIIKQFLSNPRLGNFPDKVNASIFLDENDYLSKKISKLGASYMKFNTIWVNEYSFWSRFTDYLKNVFMQFDFVVQQVSPEALHHIDHTLHFIGQTEYMMIATSVYTDEFNHGGDYRRKTMAEAFEDHEDLERFPDLEAPREEIAREAILGPTTLEINQYVRTTCQKIYNEVNVVIPQTGGGMFGGIYYAPDQDYLDECKRRLFILSPTSVGLTYVFMKAIFEGLLTTEQIKIMTRTICSYYNWTKANKLAF